MTEEEFQRLLADVRQFDWDANKREQTFRERHIAFDDAPIVFQGPIMVQRSDRMGEERYVVFGFLEDVEVVFVCTFRGTTCWIISARRARRDERKKYHHRLSRRPTAPDQE
jgi:uncharacterized DUF497 family protein